MNWVERDLLSVLAEVAAHLSWEVFHHGGFISKVHAFVAPMVIGGEQATPSVSQGVRSLADVMLAIESPKLERLGPDVLLTAIPRGS